MQIIFRVDASLETGTGHLERCRTLAHSLQNQGAEIIFISSESSNHATQSLPFKTALLPIKMSEAEDASLTSNIIQSICEKPDWIIVDHYSLGKIWEKSLRPYVKNIMVIDDLAREHDCDLLLDQNLMEDYENRYTNKVPHDCKLFLGVQYALLRPEFYEAAKNSKARVNNEIKRIFVCFGGSDPTNETTKTLDAITLFDNPDITYDIVVGAMHPSPDNIKKHCELKENLNFHHNPDNLTDIMSQADMAIGAGGTMSWERLALGIPTITISIAENQEPIQEYLGKMNYVLYLGKKKDVNPDNIFCAINDMINNKFTFVHYDVGMKKNEIIDYILGKV